MVARLLHHLAHLLLGEREHLGIGKLRFGELPQGNLRHEEDSVAVGVVEDVRMLRIMHRSRQRDLKVLQVVVVVEHGAARFGHTLPRRLLVTRHAAQPHPFAVEQQVSVANLHGANAEGVLLFVEHFDRSPATVTTMR
jgi:hypothetical protein